MHHLLLIVHLLAAAVWVGGHLVLCFGYLPRALKTKDPAIITGFEKNYEFIGIPALLLLAVTGIWMAGLYGVTFTRWFAFSDPINTVVSLKLLLLFFTILLGAHARIFIIPRLSVQLLRPMAWHIVLITLTGVTMLVLGSSVRFGGM